MNVLVLNCGSSSVKFQLIATDLDLIARDADRRLAKGTIERIGGEAIISLQVAGREPQRSTSSLRDINAAVDFIARWAASAESGIEEIKSIADIQAVGHRVVHGGERFKQQFVTILDQRFLNFRNILTSETAARLTLTNPGIWASCVIFNICLPHLAHNPTG